MGASRARQLHNWQEWSRYGFDDETTEREGPRAIDTGGTVDMIESHNLKFNDEGKVYWIQETPYNCNCMRVFNQFNSSREKKVLKSG